MQKSTRHSWRQSRSSGCVGGADCCAVLGWAGQLFSLPARRSGVGMDNCLWAGAAAAFGVGIAGSRSGGCCEQQACRSQHKQQRAPQQACCAVAALGWQAATLCTTIRLCPAFVTPHAYTAHHSPSIHLPICRWQPSRSGSIVQSCGQRCWTLRGRSGGAGCWSRAATGSRLRLWTSAFRRR